MVGAGAAINWICENGSLQLANEYGNQILQSVITGQMIIQTYREPTSSGHHCIEAHSS